ncbi:hypothetical protein QRB41_22400 [Mycobacterium avium subsp. hominissuis]|uniref:hypothetical protein n=3 Tax=Mycobacterium avium TaxID=1764 RepID=UPI001016C9FC|nr:hypothetical protein [Mycobacterium avium]MDO2386100.1 hypothetical protein [Mycobacterium avium subsp. hominissuis]
MVDMKVAPAEAGAAFSVVAAADLVSAAAGGVPGASDPLTAVCSAGVTGASGKVTDDAATAAGDETHAGDTGGTNVSNFVTTEQAGTSALNDPNVKSAAAAPGPSTQTVGDGGSGLRLTSPQRSG